MENNIDLYCTAETGAKKEKELWRFRWNGHLGELLLICLGRENLQIKVDIAEIESEEKKGYNINTLEVCNLTRTQLNRYGFYRLNAFFISRK